MKFTRSFLIAAMLSLNSIQAQTYPGNRAADSGAIKNSTSSLAAVAAAKRWLSWSSPQLFSYSQILAAMSKRDTVTVEKTVTQYCMPDGSCSLIPPPVVQPIPAPPAIVAPPAGSAPSPTASSIIVLDERAKYQNATSLSDLLAGNAPGRLTNAAHFFEPNVDGLGTNARRIDWSAPTGSEQEAFVRNWTEAPATGWYTAWKMYLGKSPTGGGVGSLGQFALGAHGNPHQKTMIWNRDNASERIYLAMRPGDTKFSIDSPFNYNSVFLSTDPLAQPPPRLDVHSMTGMVQSWVVWIQPSTGTITCWVNGVVALNVTGQNIGTSGLSSIEQTVTTFPAFPMTQYIYDFVVWR